MNSNPKNPQVFFQNHIESSKVLFALAAALKKQAGRVMLLVILYMCLLSIKSNAQGTWQALANIAPHNNYGVMLVLTDGTILCRTSSGAAWGSLWDKLTPDSYGSYINGTWSTVAPMHDGRTFFSSQVLPDGRVYVAGGEYGAGGNKSEFYTPSTDLWTPCPQIILMSNGISDANSELLYDGTVLQAAVDTAGERLNFIWDPAANTYSLADSCIGIDNEAAWLKLPDSSVLFINSYGTHSERYIPSIHKWIADGTVPVSLFDPYGYESGAAFLLPNGHGFFIGSTSTTAYYTPSGNTSPGTWTAGPAIPNSYGAPDAAAAMMPNGIILMALSPSPTRGIIFQDSTIFYEFDYTSNTFTMVGCPGTTDISLNIPSFVTNMVCLPDGNILYCKQGDDQYYEYVPGSGPLAAGQPDINNIIERACDSFTITGTLFNGISEGACFGDDWQMSSNYPSVRLISGTSVYYANTTNWNRIGAVMTGSLPDTAQFKLPPGLPNGTYNVQVVVNGNPSTNFPLTIGHAVISGVVSVCPSATIPLSSSIASGIWSSATTAIAVVDSFTGVVSGLSAGTTIISYSLGTCYSLATVTVSPAPLPIISGTGLTNMCAGSSLALSDATGSGAWSCSNTGVATIDVAGNTTGLSQGTATVTYTTGGCFATDTISVNPLPAAISGILTICNGSATMLSDAGGGTWASSNTAIAVVGTASGIVTGLFVGSAAIIYTLATGCTATALASVIPLPAAISGPSTVCAGLSVTLSDATPIGSWTSGNTSVATIGVGSGIISGINPGTTPITFTASTGCASSFVITTNPMPAMISGIPDLCVGFLTALSDGLPGGSWTSSNTSVATISGSGTVLGVIAGTSVITYDVSGCRVVIGLTVHPVPSAISGGATLCTGSTIMLSDAIAGGTWSSTNTGIATAGPTGIVTGMAIGTTGIVYTMAPGCAATATVSVSAGPSAITGSYNLCAGTISTLSDATPSGMWSSTNTAIATASGTGIIRGLTAGTCLISYSLGAGCAITGIVSVNPLPVIHTVTGGGSFCSGGAGVHIGLNTSEPGINYDLLLGPLPITTLPGTSSPLDFGLQTAAGTFTAIAVNPATSCSSNMSGSAAITILPFSTPSVSIHTSPGDTICAGTNVTYTAVPVLGGTSPSYLWTKNGIGVATGPSYFPFPSPANGDLISCTMTSDYACLTSSATVAASLTMLVKQASSILDTIKVTKSFITTGAVDTFVAIAIHAGSSPSYQWYKNGVPIPGATNAIFVSNTLADGDIIKCQVTSNDECALLNAKFSNSIVVSESAGISNTPNPESTFTISPNPNKGIFTVYGILNNPLDTWFSITVTDMLGQAIYTKTVQNANTNFTMDIKLASATANGIYFVKINSGNYREVFHIVVDK